MVERLVVDVEVVFGDDAQVFIRPMGLGLADATPPSRCCGQHRTCCTSRATDREAYRAS
jgi:hypothetical protein